MFKAYGKENLVYKFKKSPDLEIELRLPTSADEVSFERFLRKDPVMFEALVYQIALVAVRTSIADDNGALLFEESDVFGERILKLYDLPAEMITEISSAFAEFYPDWKLAE